MRRDTDGCTLDSGLTVLALRGLSDPPAYPFVERHLWRKRAVRLFAALTRLPGRTLRPKRQVPVHSR
jgi:hypothetical protein